MENGPVRGNRYDYTVAKKLGTYMKAEEGISWYQHDYEDPFEECSKVHMLYRQTDVHPHKISHVESCLESHADEGKRIRTRVISSDAEIRDSLC